MIFDQKKPILVKLVDFWTSEENKFDKGMSMVELDSKQKRAAGHVTGINWNQVHRLQNQDGCLQHYLSINDSVQCYI